MEFLVMQMIINMYGYANVLSFDVNIMDSWKISASLWSFEIENVWRFGDSNLVQSKSFVRMVDEMKKLSNKGFERKRDSAA